MVYVPDMAYYARPHAGANHTDSVLGWFDRQFVSFSSLVALRRNSIDLHDTKQLIELGQRFKLIIPEMLRKMKGLPCQNSQTS